MQFRIPLLTIFLLFFCLIGASQDLYWVGGVGAWNDPARWSLTSGGAGGAGVPNMSNNVFFDANSFNGPGQEVIITSDASCADMDWTGATGIPRLVGTAARTINIHGSLTFISAMVFPYEGNVAFRAASGNHTITSAGQRFFGDIIFDGGAMWTLIDAFEGLQTMIFREGTFVSADQDVNIRGIESDFPNPRTFDLGNSTIRVTQVPARSGPSVRFANAGLNWISPNSNFIFENADSASLVLEGSIDFQFNSVVFDIPYGVLSSDTDQPPLISSFQFLGDGEVSGNHTIPVWTLTMGRTIFLENGSVQNVEDFITGDICDGLAILTVPDGEGEIATLFFDRVPVFIEGLFLRGVHADNATNRRVPLLRSRNGGNIGFVWDFISLPPDDKYWVGGSGDWRDRNNWSDASGGMGGACLPNPGDNIFFDENSFNSPNDIVTSTFPIYVNDITYTYPNSDVMLDIPALYVNNDLEVTTSLNWNIPDVYLIGNDEAGNSSNTDNQFINAPLITFTNIISESQREINIISDMMIAGRLIIGGFGDRARFRIRDVLVTAQEVYSVDSEVDIELDNSTIVVTGPNVTILRIGGVSGSGLWELINENATLESDQTGFDRVFFNNENGSGTVASDHTIGINNLEFLGDGLVAADSIFIDDLVLAPGQDYRLGTSWFEIRDSIVAPGTICSVIALSTNLDPSDVSIQVNNVNTDLMSYVEIYKVDVSGGAPYAGDGSVNLGDSDGWMFPSTSENSSIRQFLGDDIHVCGDSTVLLQPFMADEIMSITWNNGSSNDLTFPVSQIAQDVIATVDLIDGCSLTDTVNVAFDQLFDLEIGNDTLICEGTTLQLTSNITDADSYEWSTGDSVIAIDVGTANTYRLTAVRGACASTASVMVMVSDIQDFSLGQDTTFCEGEIYNLESPPLTSGTFVWSDGSSTPTFEIRDNGTYWVEVSQGNCSRRDSIQVTYDPAINLDVILAPFSICSDSILVLDPGAGMDSYLWDINDVNTGNTDQTFEVSEMNTDTVIRAVYSVEVSRGACTEKAPYFVQVTPVPSVSLGISDTTICNNQTLQLNAPVNPDYNLEWSDGTNGPTLPIVNSGTYWLEVEQNGCASRDSVEVTLQIFESVFLGNDTTLCVGESLQLEVDNTAQFYNWSTGETDPNILIDMPGTYSVEVIDGSCVANDTIQVDYLSLDALSLTTDTTLCEGTPLRLDASLAGVTNYNWTEVNSGAQVSNMATIEITTAGTYMVELSNGTCMTSATTDVSFDPAINFRGLGMDTDICDGEQIGYNFNIPNATYAWQDGSTLSNYTISDSGLYFITVVRNTCIESDSIMVNVRPLPVIGLSTPDALCEGEDVELSVSESGLTYDWSTGANEQSITVSQSGNYSVSASDGSCTNSDSITVTFNALPEINLGSDIEICEGESVEIGLMDSNLGYQWSTGDQTQTIVIDEADNYSLTITDSNGCKNSDSITLVVNPSPVFQLPETTGLCDGESADLEVSVNFDNLVWSTGETSNIINVADEGIVWAEATLGICNYRDSTSVAVQNFPIVELGADTFICSGDQFVLDATNVGAIYNWNTGETTPDITITDGGTYNVDVDLNGCVTSDAITITSRRSPVFQFANATEFICDGEEIELNTTHPEWQTTWSNGDSGPSSMVSEAGLYIATAIDDECSFSDSVQLNVGTIPEFNLGDDFAQCDEITTTLVVELSDVDVFWNTGDVGNALTVDTMGTYIATAVSNEGCEFTDQIIISNRECIRFSIYVPNTFSPTATLDENKRFQITPTDVNQINAYEINIFDRWGNRLYTSTNIDDSWDGSGLGFNTLQSGVYTYTIMVNYTDDFISDRIEYFNGSVTLLR